LRRPVPEFYRAGPTRRPFFFQSTSKHATAGQWDYGVPSPPRHGRPADHADSRAARAEWFARSLEQLGRLGLESVAFPHGVGCGLAGGDWTVYRAAIERFAVEHPETRVSIVALP
jgi:hypothetical protein